VRWERAVHHVRTAAEEVARARALPFLELPAHELWAVGDVTGPVRDDVESVTVGLCVDLPPEEVAWWTIPERGAWWLGSTRIPRNPVVVWWRSSRAPVWNHRIVGPVLVWDDATGLHEDALDALRGGRGAQVAAPPPDAPALGERLLAERAASLAAVRRRTAAYEAQRWRPGEPGPYGDALADACAGYLDVVDALADPGA
jgi:hypothetical protein